MRFTLLTYRSLLFTSIILFLSACTEIDSPDDSDVIATVGNHSLTFNQALTAIPSVILTNDTLSAIKNYKNQWIESQLLLREADRLQLSSENVYREKLRQLETQLSENMLREYILSSNSDQLNVTRQEAQNYFQAHRDKFILDERYVRFRHITTNTRARADNARRDIMRGIDWETVAERYSLNPDLQIRESTQFWPISIALSDIPLLNRYLNVIGISEISPVHQFRGEFHFVQLMEERNEGDHPDFNWLIPQIEEWLRLEKARKLTNAYIRNLYLEAESGNLVQEISTDELNNVIEKSSTQ